MVYGFPKPRPSILSKRDARLERERATRELHAALLARDGRRCRCCLREGTFAVGGEKALHRHHIQARSLSKAGKLDIRNLVTICAICHALIHAKQLWIVGADANQRLTFEIHEAAVVDAFGTRPLPRHVGIVTESRRS